MYSKGWDRKKHYQFINLLGDIFQKRRTLITINNASGLTAMSYKQTDHTKIVHYYIENPR